MSITGREVSQLSFPARPAAYRGRTLGPGHEMMTRYCAKSLEQSGWRIDLDLEHRELAGAELT